MRPIISAGQKKAVHGKSGQFLRCVATVLFLFLATGCETPGSKKQPAGGVFNMQDHVTRTAPLMVAKGPNETKLAWESEKAVMYTVQIRDGLYQNSRWINHPALVQIRGTGERIEYVDHPGPTEKRKYRLKELDLTKPRPALKKR